MTYRAQFISFLTLLCTAYVQPALAATRGEVSQTINISITISPHVRAELPEAAAKDGKNPVCLSSTGIRNFGVAVFHEHGSSRADLRAAAREQFGCGANGRLIDLAQDESGTSKLLGRSTPITLLVTPY